MTETVRYRIKPLGKRRPIPLNLDLDAVPHPHWPRGLPMPCTSPSCACLHFVVGVA